MKRLGEFLKTFQQWRFANKERISQYFGHVTMLTALGTTYLIAKQTYQKYDDNRNSKHDLKYVLIGNKTIVDRVERHIRLKLGEPSDPFFLLKWRYTEIAKIQANADLEKLKTEKKPIVVYLCTSAKPIHSKEKFFLPKIPSDLPKLKSTGIVVVKEIEDDQDAVDKSLTSAFQIQGVKDFFENAPVLQMSTHTQHKDTDIQVRVAFLTIALYTLSGVLYVTRRRYFSKIK